MPTLPFVFLPTRKHEDLYTGKKIIPNVNGKALAKKLPN